MSTATKIKLENVDLWVVLDKSGSMDEEVKAGSKMSRWQASQEYIAPIVKRLGELDDDGIDIVCFSGKFGHSKNVTPASISEVWKQHRPGGSTDTAGVLKYVLGECLARTRGKAKGEFKNQMVLVLTDGIPDSEPAVADIIVATTKAMEYDEQIGIQFAQVGDNAQAAAFLSRLDNNLESAGAKFDIVDTKTLDELAEMTIEQVADATFND